MKVDSRRAEVVEKKSTTAPRYEHITRHLMRTSNLSEFGAEGWELVTVLPDSCDPAMGFFYFKRKVQP